MADREQGSRGARPRRQAAAKPKPCQAYYMGYVEDEETPEAIMAKFQLMEQVRLG